MKNNRRIKRIKPRLKKRLTYRYYCQVDIVNNESGEVVGQATLALFSKIKLITQSNIEAIVYQNMDELSNVDTSENSLNIKQWLEL